MGKRLAACVLLAVVQLLASVPAQADARLGPGSFNSPVRTLSGAGVTITYPEGAFAGINLLGSAAVDLAKGRYTVSARRDPAFRNYGDQLAVLRRIEERHGDRRIFEVYESTFRGVPCLVAKQTPSSDALFPGCDIFVYPDEDTIVYISARRTSVRGSLKDLMENEEVLAVIAGVTW